MSAPNPFGVTGAPERRPPPNAWSLLSDEERAAVVADARDWRVRLADSLARAGFDSADEYLAAVGAIKADHPQLDERAVEPRVEPAVDDDDEFEPTALRVVPTSTLPALADYLGAVVAFACRYVAFPSEHESVAVALWVAHAWVVERFETSPILSVTSAEMRSGKTRVLDLLALLVPQPFRVITPSEAIVYTVLAQRPRPTMLLDEADAIFGPRTAERYEGLRAILNSGNQQDTPVMRVKLEGRRREVDAFDVFGPKAVAGIGSLPTTVADRAIPIRMKRRMPDEPIAKFRRRTAQAEAARLVLDWSAVTLGTDVPVPDELNDRAADSWEPCLAIADAAGGSWPVRARLAAIALSSEEDSTVSVGMRLLTDIRDVFGDESHLTTAELLHRLHELEDAPWEDWYGKPLSGRGLAKLLGPYRVAPVKRRLDGGQSRGYFRSEFEDAWSRYVPGSVPSVPSVPAERAGTDGTDGTVPQVDDPGDGSSLFAYSDDPAWPPALPEDVDPPTAWAEVMG